MNIAHELDFHLLQMIETNIQNENMLLNQLLCDINDIASKEGIEILQNQDITEWSLKIHPTHHIHNVIISYLKCKIRLKCNNTLYIQLLNMMYSRGA